VKSVGPRVAFAGDRGGDMGTVSAVVEGRASAADAGRAVDKSEHLPLIEISVVAMDPRIDDGGHDVAGRVSRSIAVSVPVEVGRVEPRASDPEALLLSMVERPCVQVGFDRRDIGAARESLDLFLAHAGGEGLNDVKAAADLKATDATLESLDLWGRGGALQSHDDVDRRGLAKIEQPLLKGVKDAAAVAIARPRCCFVVALSVLRHLCARDGRGEDDEAE